MYESRLMLSPDGDIGGGEGSGGGDGGAIASVADFSDDSTADWAGDGKITRYGDHRQTQVPKSDFSRLQNELKATTTMEATRAAHQQLNQRFMNDSSFRAQLRAELDKLEPQSSAGNMAPSDLDQLMAEIDSGPNKGWMNTKDLRKVLAARDAGSSAGINGLRNEVRGAFKSMLQINQDRDNASLSATQARRKQEILLSAQGKYPDHFEGDNGMTALEALYHGFDGSDNLDEFEPQFVAGLERHIEQMGIGSNAAARRRAQESEGRVFATNSGGTGDLLPRDPSGRPNSPREVAQAVARSIVARNTNV